jgi:hypothetical protein
MLLSRAFPKLFSQHEVGSKYVCFQDCSFQVRKGRESTARVVVCRELNIPCSFTLEATFCGLGYGPLKHCHMNIGHMCEVKYLYLKMLDELVVRVGLFKGIVFSYYLKADAFYVF